MTLFSRWMHIPLLWGLGSLPAWAGTDRPSARTFALGGGLTIPTSALLDTSSIRLRLDPGFTLEALAGFSSTTTTSTTTSADPTTAEDTTLSTLGLALGLRAVLASRSKVEAQALAGFQLERSSSELDPEGTRNNSSQTTQQLHVRGGLGLEYFLSSHWSASVDCITSVYSVLSSKTNDELLDVEVDMTGSTIALDPRMRLLIHLYF